MVTLQSDTTTPELSQPTLTDAVDREAPPGAHVQPPDQSALRQLAIINLLVETLTDGVILLDEDCRVIDANDAAARMVGQPLPVGTSWADLAIGFRMSTPDGTLLPHDRLPSMRVLAGETLRDAEVSITRADGHKAHISVSGSPLAAGGMRGAVMVLRDITERVRREREAAALQTLSRQLAGAEQDINAVYSTVVARVADITGASTVRLMVYEPESRTLRRAAVQTASGRATTDALAIRINDPSLDALAARTRLPAVVPDFAEVAGHTRRGSAVAVPLIVRDELVGTLSCDLPEPHEFNDTEMAFLGTIATQSAIAIANANMLQQLARERSFLTNIIDHLPAGLVVFDVVHGSGRRATKPDYRITMLNEQAISFLPPGLFERAMHRRGGIIGLRIRRLVTDEPTERLIAWLDSALDRQAIVTSEEIHFDHIHDGTGPDNFWSAAVMPLAAYGRVGQLVLLATNITDQVTTRRRVEELVRIAGTRAAELEATVSAMTDAVTVCDATGDLRLANGAMLDTYGVESLAELIRMGNAEERVHLRQMDGSPARPDDRPLARALTGETLQADFTMFHHGLGRDIHRRVSAAPVRDSANEIIGAVAVETDITGLIEVDRLKDEFFSMAAHELRTPLTAIKGYAQILSKQALPAEEAAAERARRALTTVREQSERMERLINDLLDVARIQSRQLEFHYREFDLVALLEQLVAETGRGDLRHVIRCDADPVSVIGRWDRDRLAQVFGNLLTNAVKYSPDGGVIDVVVRRRDEPGQGERVVVSVSDQGIGIPSEQIPRLFARYSRVGDRSHYQQSGLGLGLYITKEIIDSHGGAITVRSEPGRGSTFTVTLPLDPPAKSSRSSFDA